MQESFELFEGGQGLQLGARKRVSCNSQVLRKLKSWQEQLLNFCLVRILLGGFVEFGNKRICKWMIHAVLERGLCQRLCRGYGLSQMV